MATDNLARGLAATKLSKKGGTIAGDLEITGDLNVRGTTVTTRQETLFIKDNMIVTNADGKTLQGASGIAIRSGQNVVYGLVYEPRSDTVMFGQGSLDSNNNFTFNSGEGLPIAIRADSSLFVDGHFVKWDATQYCFVDGGSVADIPNQKPFRESWTTTSFTALIADVYADTTVVAGDVYIGTVSGGIAGGMPFNGNAEVRIEVNTANRGVLHCEVTSSNVAPYHWECQVVSGVIYSWRSWVLTKPDGTNDLISNNKINNTYLDTDSSPTEDSTKPVQSGGVYTALSDKLGTSGDGSSTTVAFTEAQERTNVATGETQATLWGKIKKWFSDLKTVAFSGSYSDLSGKPTIPTALNDLTTDLTASKALVSDANGKVSASSVTSTELGYVSGVTSAIQTQLNGKLGTSGDGSSTTVTFTDAQTRTNVATGETQATLWGKVKKWFTDLKTVAFTGSYSDLSGKPTIPAPQVNSDWNATSGVAEILNKPTIPDAQVNSDWDAESGVAAILNKPTIPAAQVNSDWNAESGVAQILNKPTIPTQTSDLTNNGNGTLHEGETDPFVTQSFVNSSIATNTANFIGTFQNVTTLNAYSGTVTNNDYAFVVNSVVQYNSGDFPDVATLNAYDKTLLTNFDYAWVVNGAKFDLYRYDIVDQTWYSRATAIEKNDSLLNTAYNRYKATVSGSTATWDYEYTLNNSSFTAAQWAAINSNITSSLTSQITTNANNISGITNGTSINTFSGVESALSGKQATITGAATTITSSNLTASKALVSDINGKVAVSAVTSTELGYVSGVTSSIQTQLNGKLGTSGDGSSTTVTFTDAQTRTNVATGETQATLWGKVKKWFADLGTAAFKNVPVSGDASTTEVVMGDDTRLTNARNAADVYSWAKAATKPTYSYSEITDTPTIGNGQLKLQKNGSEIGGFYANTSYDNTIDIKSYDLRDYMRFGTDGIYWNLWASTDATDDFLSTLTLDSDAQVAACIVRFNNGVGIYSVPLADMGGTGYAVAIVDEATFTPQVLLYVSVADTTNTNILLQRFGLTATDDGWQVSDQLVASGHTFLGSTTMSIPAGGVMPNDRGANKMHRVDAFFGSSNAQWQALDALYGVVLGDVNTQLTALNSGAGV